MTTRIAGSRGELLWELEIATPQSVARADAIAPEKYDWCPDTNARSVSFVNGKSTCAALHSSVSFRRGRVCGESTSNTSRIRSEASKRQSQAERSRVPVSIWTRTAVARPEHWVRRRTAGPRMPRCQDGKLPLENQVFQSKVTAATQEPGTHGQEKRQQPCHGPIFASNSPIARLMVWPAECSSTRQAVDVSGPLSEVAGPVLLGPA
jgi:hypothetical protein